MLCRRYALNVGFNLQNKTIFNYFPFPWTVSAVHVTVGLAYCTVAYFLGAKNASFQRVLLLGPHIVAELICTSHTSYCDPVHSRVNLQLHEIARWWIQLHLVHRGLLLLFQSLTSLTVPVVLCFCAFLWCSKLPSQVCHSQTSQEALCCTLVHSANVLKLHGLLHAAHHKVRVPDNRGACLHARHWSRGCQPLLCGGGHQSDTHREDPGACLQCGAVQAHLGASHPRPSHRNSGAHHGEHASPTFSSLKFDKSSPDL